MPKRPPLSLAELKAIQERHSGQEDVIALLWEIHRLRAWVLRSHDLLRQPRTSQTAEIMAASLLRILEEEPVVKEQPTL